MVLGCLVPRIARYRKVTALAQDSSTHLFSFPARFGTGTCGTRGPNDSSLWQVQCHHSRQWICRGSTGFLNNFMGNKKSETIEKSSPFFDLFINSKQFDKKRQET